MDALERKVKEKIIDLDKMNQYKYAQFKKEYKTIYEAFLETFREIQASGIKNDSLTLFCPKISKLTLKLNNRKVLRFCGCYMFRGAEVTVFENIHTFGTYFFEDSKIFKQLKDSRMGVNIGLEKTKEGVNMTLPQERVREGLFE